MVWTRSKTAAAKEPRTTTTVPRSQQQVSLQSESSERQLQEREMSMNSDCVNPPLSMLDRSTLPAIVNARDHVLVNFRQNARELESGRDHVLVNHVVPVRDNTTHASSHSHNFINQASSQSPINQAYLQSFINQASFQSFINQASSRSPINQASSRNRVNSALFQWVWEEKRE